MTLTYARNVARRPVVLSNIGVGPLTTRRGRCLARAIVRQASLLSVRDAASHAMCVALGCSPETVLVLPDAVFVNASTEFLDQPCDLSRPRDEPGENQSVPLKVGLNLNHDVDDPDSWDSYLAQLRTALRTLARTTPVELVALPMQSCFKQDNDLVMLRSFLDSVPEIPSVLHEPTDHREVAAIIATCDVVLAERLHAIVIAAIIGRPIVGLMHNIKVRELVGQRLSTIATGFRGELEQYFGDIETWLQDLHHRERSALPRARHSHLCG